MMLRIESIEVICNHFCHSEDGFSLRCKLGNSLAALTKSEIMPKEMMKRLESIASRCGISTIELLERCEFSITGKELLSLFPY